MSENKTKKPYALYTPANSSRWSVRFSIKGQGQQRIALGTEDKKETKRLALKKWSGAVELAEIGLSVTQKAFPVIAQEFIDKIACDVRHGDKEVYHPRQFPPIINRYFIGFFVPRSSRRSVSVILRTIGSGGLIIGNLGKGQATLCSLYTNHQWPGKVIEWSLFD